MIKMKASELLIDLKMVIWIYKLKKKCKRKYKVKKCRH